MGYERHQNVLNKQFKVVILNHLKLQIKREGRNNMETIAEELSVKFDLEIKENGNVLTVDVEDVYYPDDKIDYLQELTDKMVNYIRTFKEIFDVDYHLTYEYIKLFLFFN